MRLPYFFIALITLLELSACDSQEATPLVGDLFSQASPEDVQQRIGASANSWTIVDNSPTTRDDGSPTYFVAEVSKFSHLGFTGRARFVFFEDQLVSVQFYPMTANEYKEALEASGINFEFNFDLDVHQAEVLPGTDISYYAESGAFTFADRRMSLTAVDALSGET